MHVINARNVNDAFASGLEYLAAKGIEENSRNGKVVVAPGPVTTVYERPLERVLFSPLRDANPWLHLFESLWMLAGHNDVAFPAYFAKNMLNYSDDGKTMHGAYGERWRTNFGINQLRLITEELRRNPASRRCVLQMWDCRLIGKNDLMTAINGGRDVPCNTHAYFDCRGGRVNLTVCCRSNDIIWGAYGANAVHFAFLLEYVAAVVGIPVGVYRQISNNYHIYTEQYPKDKWIDLIEDAYIYNLYIASPIKLFPLMQNHELWFDELHQFFDDPFGDYKEPFFRSVALPMYAAWHARKTK